VTATPRLCQGRIEACSRADTPEISAAHAYYHGAMFVGHPGAGLVAKRLAPRMNLGWLFLAAMLLDVLLWSFVLLGLEEVHVPAGRRLGDSQREASRGREGSVRRLSAPGSGRYPRRMSTGDLRARADETRRRHAMARVRAVAGARASWPPGRDAVCWPGRGPSE
jgi:hypothetical protein